MQLVLNILQKVIGVVLVLYFSSSGPVCHYTIKLEDFDEIKSYELFHKNTTKIILNGNLRKSTEKNFEKCIITSYMKP